MHSESIVPGPSLVVGRKGSAGSVFLSEGPCWPIDTAYYARVSEHLDSRFAYYLLIDCRLDRLDQSTAIPSLGRDQYNNVRIALPPLAEQRRIVVKIDELFGEIEAGEQKLEKALESLAAYRRAMLKAAVTGELTRDWRNKNKPNESGTQLFDRILAERSILRRPAEPRGFELRARESSAVGDSVSPADPLPTGWAWALLDQLSILITSGSRGWKRYYANTGKIFIRAQNLKHDRIDLENVAYVSLPENAEGTRTKIRAGDILITITGANVTKSGQVDTELGEAYVNQHVGLVRPAIPAISDFLFLVVICPTHGRKHLETAAYGAGKPGLALGDLASMRIPLPPMEEQVIIADRMRMTLATIENTFRDITGTAKAIPVWRSAVLKAAFSGSLVPQDPRDEPANAVLERLRAGNLRVALTLDKRRRAKGKTDANSTVIGCSRNSGGPAFEDLT